MIVIVNSEMAVQTINGSKQLGNSGLLIKALTISCVMVNNDTLYNWNS